MRMSSTQQSKLFDLSLVLKIGAGVAACIWLLKSCDDRQQKRDIEMKGRGMLETKGIYGDLPDGTGAYYFYMREDGATKNQDYSKFFARIKDYQTARGELRKRGLSESDLDNISEYSLIDAMRSGSAKEALDRLAEQYR
jgi:hypothetical protein